MLVILWPLWGAYEWEGVSVREDAVGMETVVEVVDVVEEEMRGILGDEG